MKPNILLLIIDSFNAEKFFGNKKTSFTPTLDKLIKQGTYFTQAIGVAPTTVPAVASIFTGLYPHYSVNKKEKVLTINENVKNYVEKLRECGYDTHALVPKILSLVNLESIFKENIEDFDSFATLYDDVGEKILQNIEFKLKEPWFYYVHLMDLHGSATFHLSKWPSKYQNDKYGKNRYERMVSAMDSWLDKIMKKINFENTILVITADHGSFTAYYDKEMERQNDLSNKKRETNPTVFFKIAHKIFTNLSSSNPLRKYLSDKYIDLRNKRIDSKIQSQVNATDFSKLRPYKKRLLENSIKSSAKLYDEICRIPLLFLGPTVPKNIKICDQVKNLDIFPTLFDIIGITIPTNTSAQSLLPIINGNKLKTSDVYLYSITNSDVQSVVGIRTENYKYFRKINDSINSAFLFNLKNDPYEEFNLIGKEKALSQNLEQKISKFFTCDTETKIQSDEDEEIKNELKKLGYL